MKKRKGMRKTQLLMKKLLKKWRDIDTVKEKLEKII